MCNLDCCVVSKTPFRFTAWSSTREPTQVFKLLETIYRGFDRIARKRKVCLRFDPQVIHRYSLTRYTSYQVFKVETIGDCYVAVTGMLAKMTTGHSLKAYSHHPILRFVCHRITRTAARPCNNYGEICERVHEQDDRAHSHVGSVPWSRDWGFVYEIWLT